MRTPFGSFPNKRRFIVISGYLGFDNLGDEAILASIIEQLHPLATKDQIVALSANPRKTAKIFGVRSIQRLNFAHLILLLTQARLFISGGGGLFQNTRSLGSILFYGAQIMLAKACGATTMIYGQGLGPFHGHFAENLTRYFLNYTDTISVRDNFSYSLLKKWGREATRSADPVWLLNSSPLPIKLAASKQFFALSLRPSSHLTYKHLQLLCQCIAETIPPNCSLLLLPLHKGYDELVLQEFAQLWQSHKKELLKLDLDELEHPGQWLSLFKHCKLVISMRLHGLIMALKEEIPVVGIAYDPKVTQLLQEFAYPILNLTKESQAEEWKQAIQNAFLTKSEHLAKAKQKVEAIKSLACQNINLLTKILNMPRDN